MMDYLMADVYKFYAYGYDKNLRKHKKKIDSIWVAPFNLLVSWSVNSRVIYDEELLAEFLQKYFKE